MNELMDTYGILMVSMCQLKPAGVPAAGISQDKPPQRDVGIACDLAKHKPAACKAVNAATT